jgi:hypothetical protein
MPLQDAIFHSNSASSDSSATQTNCTTELTHTQLSANPSHLQERSTLHWMLMSFGAVTLIGFAFFVRFQPTSVSLSSEAFAEPIAHVNSRTQDAEQFMLAQSTVPTEPRVAGAGVQQAAAADSNFGVIAAEAHSAETPLLGIMGECSVGEVFAIGKPERSPADNPVDELSWAEALDFVAPYSNPFIIGQSVDGEFPWRTSATIPDTLSTTVSFSYTGSAAAGELALGWSPGKVGEKAKRVLLNGTEIGTTPMRTGEFVAGWWEQMPRFVDTLPLELTPGEHTLMIEHIATDGSDAAVWDFIQVAITSCE